MQLHDFLMPHSCLTHAFLLHSDAFLMQQWYELQHTDDMNYNTQNGWQYFSRMMYFYGFQAFLFPFRKFFSLKRLNYRDHIYPYVTVIIDC